MFDKIIIAILSAALCAQSADYSRVLVNMGYAVSGEPIETVEVIIPEDWNAVYRRYNDLQAEGGFDLWPYRGRRCTRYTYAIPEQNARGNVLVYRGNVIGGDICSITLDGIMLPIEKDKLK